jgi:hypothetical protein
VSELRIAKKGRNVRSLLLAWCVVLFSLTLVSGRCLAGTVNIHAIAVDLPNSPYLGDTVTTTGIVIAVLGDGFYIENNTGWDSNTCSSEGIYVYTPTITPANYVSLQDSVTVTGLVEASNSSSYAGVQIYIASPDVSSTGNIVINSSGNTLPSVVSSSVLTAATSGTCSDYSANSFGQWLPFEGMRVNVPSSSSLLVTQGTGGTVDAATPLATSNGQFWAVFSTTRPMRSEGIDLLDPTYDSAVAAKPEIAVWNGNPQLLLVDTTTLGGTALEASAGTKYSGSSELVGIIDYHVSTQGYTGLLLTSSSVSALSAQSGNTPTAASARKSSRQILFATLDLNSLLESESSRVTKLATAVKSYLRAPDVLAVQGATSAALTDLVSAVSTATGDTYTLSSLSTTVSGCTTNCLYNAFLINTSTGVFDGTPTVEQRLAATEWTYTPSSSSSSSVTETLFDRSPLLLTAKIKRADGLSDYTLYAVNVSLMDRSELSATATSEYARERRMTQAEILATGLLVSIEDNPTIVMGGFNSFEFSDGYVDTLGIVDNNETSSSYVWLYDSNMNSTALTNSTTSAYNLTEQATNPSTSRYSYVESGSAEQPDHILYTSDLDTQTVIDYARIGADFPVSASYDTSTVARASSHDAVIAYLAPPYPTTTTLTSDPNPSVYEQSVKFTATVAVTNTTDSSDYPDGTVTFYDETEGATLGSETLSNGVATLTTSALSVGTHTIKASYGGSESYMGYLASEGTVDQVVDKDTTTLSVSGAPNPSYYGNSVKISVTASSSGETPSGTVTFYDTDQTTVLGTGTLSSGATSITISTLTVGTHTIYAEYGGDSTNAAATASYEQTVLALYSTSSTLSCSPLVALLGTTINCTDTVSSTTGTPSGTITYYDGSTALGTATVTSGKATFSLSSLAAGSHTITAVFAGNDPYQTSTSNAQIVLIISGFTLTATPASQSVYTGEAASYEITVTPGSAFTLDVALSCSGAPDNSTCTITPSAVTGGSGTAKMTIQTTAPSRVSAVTPITKAGRAAPLLAILFLPWLARRRRGWWALVLALSLISGGVMACGGAGTLSGGTTAGGYTVTISGTASYGGVTVNASTPVTLQVKSLF